LLGEFFITTSRWFSVVAKFADHKYACFAYLLYISEYLNIIAWFVKGGRFFNTFLTTK